MNKKAVLFIVVFFAALVNTSYAIQCVPYARMITGIMIHGNAWTWWNQASELGYTRGNHPEIRAVLSFPIQDGAPVGHVAVASKIISSSEIRVDHANWEVAEEVALSVKVVDVSGGNWTKVKVGTSPKEWNSNGFIYDSFVRDCIHQTPPASYCTGEDIDYYLECRDTNLCDINGLGGANPASLPDFFITKIWLEDASGNDKTVFLPGEQIKMKAQFKNKGGNATHDIEVRFYLSNGEHVDSNKQSVGTDNIHYYNIESGETHTETEGMYAPTTPGTYNITACADTQHDVTEEHESNNCSDEAVFIVPINCETAAGEWSNECFMYFNSVFRHRHR